MLIIIYRDLTKMQQNLLVYLYSDQKKKKSVLEQIVITSFTVSLDFT